MKRALLTLAVAALVLGVVIALRAMSAAGVFATIEPVSELACRSVSGAPGAEDIVFDRTTGVAYISSFDRRAAARGAVRGAIYAFSPSSAAAPRDITPPQPADFQPHGLSLYYAPDGTKSLFVVNHPGGTGQAVEIFDLRPDGTLVHRRTVADPAFVSLNDVQAVGRDRFYVTNDHGIRKASWRLIEDYALLPLASVVYFDGVAGRVVAKGLTYANGIALSQDRTTLYVAETTGRSLKIFQRDVPSGNLRLTASIFAGFGLDNIDIDAGGTVWITGHPKLFAFLAHAADAGKRSPTRVVRLVSDDHGQMHFQTVYLEPGAILSGGSIAARRQDRLLIGSVFEPVFLMCDLPSG